MGAPGASTSWHHNSCTARAPPADITPNCMLRRTARSRALLLHLTPSLLSVAATLAPLGCAAPPSRSAGETQKLRTATELSARLLDISDFATASFELEVTRCAFEGATQQQLSAMELTRNSATSNIRSLALGSDPAGALVDMYVYIGLAAWSCENRATARSELLVLDCSRTYGAVKDRVQSVADEIMTPKQRQELDALIDDFKTAHPNRLSIGLMRLTELARLSGNKVRILEAAAPDMLSPVTDAARQLEQARLLGNRVIWLLSRLPTSAGWEAQTVVRTALESDEVEHALQHADRLGDRLDAARAALGALDGRVQQLGSQVDGLGKGVDSLGAELRSMQGARSIAHEAMLLVTALAVALAVVVVVAARWLARSIARHPQGADSP